MSYKIERAKRTSKILQTTQFYADEHKHTMAIEYFRYYY